ncbi:MAG: hypothetical protein FJZ38_19080 [Candidatus Rokubacteria bacterium]|nr:hypothetical protein [Candidatus Rokubacteria bacterium]
MLPRTLRTFAAVGLAAIGLSGCASGTLVAKFGPLPGGATLVTLVVSEHVDVVRQECAEVGVFGRVLGCQSSQQVRHPSGVLPLRAVKIVRYTERLPSAATFEIDAHELCHVVASLQLIDDPCHVGNDGVLQAHGAGAAMPRLR